MLEAVMGSADTLKKVLEAVKELVTDANFDCSDDGIKLQAMDNSHVALVSLSLNSTGFESYRCDRNMSLGMSIASLTKIIKCADTSDTVTLRADESQDVLGLLFENKKTDRVAEYSMKLMDIDTEHLGIPDTVYDATIALPAAEFAKIIRDLKEMGESVKIEATKEGVRFSADGDIGTSSVTIRPTDKDGNKKTKGGDDDDDEEEEEEEEEEEAVKEEKPEVDDDDDVIIQEAPAASGGEKTAADDDKPEVVEVDEKPEVTQAEAEAEEEEAEEDEDEPVKSKKRKAAAKKEPKGKGKEPAAKKAKKEDEPRRVTINLQQTVTLTFSIKYLSNFAKSTPLSDYVHLHMSNEVPLLVEYPFAAGHIRYYLAPKISED